MPQNTQTKGTITIGNQPRSGLRVEVYEQDYDPFGIIELPFPKKLGTSTTSGSPGQQGEYSVSYSPADYGGFLDEEENQVETKPAQYIDNPTPIGPRRIMISPAQYGPGMPDLFIKVYRDHIEYKSHPVVKDVWDETCTIIYNIDEDDPGETNVVQVLYDAVTTVIETVCDLGATVIETTTNIIADGIELGANIYGAGLDFFFGDGAGDSARQNGKRIADAVRKWGQDKAEGIRESGESSRYSSWEGHYIFSSNLDRSVPSVPQYSTAAFNNAIVESRYSYTDSGIRCCYRIRGGIVEYKNQHTQQRWTVLKRPEANHPEICSYTIHRMQDFEEVLPDSGIRFDMIAADGNRILVKEAGRDNFYFTTVVDEFLHCVKLDKDNSNYHVPGCYIKLDPENNLPNVGRENLCWWTDADYDHPAMAGYAFLPLMKYGIGMLNDLAQFLIDRLREQMKLLIGYPISLNTIIDPQSVPPPIAFPAIPDHGVLPDLMMIKVEPLVWHLLDTRPPYGSGKPPRWVNTYNHVTYATGGVLSSIIPSVKGLAGIKDPHKSIEYYKVLSIGVGNAHRHIHYEDTLGGEICSGPDNFINGPIKDRDGSWDGTCNFYMLCQLKNDDAIQRDAHTRDAYGILWIDEQSYFSERWRLLHYDDNNWGPLRGWSLLTSVKRFLNLEDIRFHFAPTRFWCPFRAGCINGNSRMATKRHVLVIAGKDPVTGRHELYSINFSWGTLDRTWRWRFYPDNAEVIENETSVDAEKPHSIYPQTVGIREDMTIYMKGTLKIGDQIHVGYWYQKYLPADNYEVPGEDKLTGQNSKPQKRYNHQWKFISDNNFHVADSYSHFGVYNPTVDSRSQYYPLIGQPPQSLESTRWTDKADELFVIQPCVNLNTTRIVVHRPPSQFKDSENERREWTSFKIVNRGKKHGWIAMHWDKREDDLLSFYFLPSESTKNVVLLSNDYGEWTATLGRRKIKWFPPVVQNCTISMITDETNSTNGMITVRIQFESRINKRMRTLEEDFLDEIPELRQLRLSPHEHDPYMSYASVDGTDPYPCRDHTIWKVQIHALEHGEPKILFDKDICEFEEVNDFSFRHDWIMPVHEYNEKLHFLTVTGSFLHASSVVFWDLVGHVNTAEHIEFIIQ